MKPYYKKLGRVENFDIWLVDDEWIRNNKTVYFVDVGINKHFKFIPENEIWISRELRKEARYLIERVLLENKFMKTMSYGTAHNKAISIETKERRKNKITGKIYRKLLINDKIKVWLVSGVRVRNRYDADFSGSHDCVDRHVPRNEIWIDDSMSEIERKMMMIHELYERNLMSRGMCYKPAHKKASDYEARIRKNKNKLNSAIKYELKKINN